MKKILVETSARHIHLSGEDYNLLVGEGCIIDEKHITKPLSQPGQYATDIKVKIVGPKGSLMCTLLGPTRNKTQIEISLTDSRTIGVSAPIRESGQLDGSASVKIIGPAGEITIDEGLIIAKRHIHMDPSSAEEIGVQDNQVVDFEVLTEERRAIFCDTVVRVHPSFALAMHIDTDEANATNCKGEVYGRIVK